MTKTTNIKAMLLTFCAVGVLAAANQSWAAGDIANCAQVTATTETDVDSTPDNKADTAAILAAVTGATNEDDESCAVLTVESIYDFGDAPDDYGTTGATAAKHEIIPGLKLGGTVDFETDGQPGVDADGDGIDEDGVTGFTNLQDGSAVTLQVTATNTTGSDATVGCWIDYNNDQAFDSSEYAEANVPTGSDGTTPIPVAMPAVPANASTTMPNGTYARCRLTTDTMDGTNATGLLSDGEVEDYKVTFAAQPVFDLALVKRVSTSQTMPIKRGDTVTFTIEVINQGNVEAKDVVVSDYIPTGLTLADTNWTASGNTATLVTAIPLIAAGASETVTISFTVAESAMAGELTNAAEISSAKDGNGDPATDVDSVLNANPGDNTVVKDDEINENGTVPGEDDDANDEAKITVVVDPEVDINLVKTVTDMSGSPITTIRRGEQVKYVLTVTNDGPDIATGVVVKDVLPATLQYDSDDGAGAYTGGIWTVGEVTVGAAGSKMLTITATVK
ncbi:DUF11 domain-containing protein [Thiothrix nivea]|uniref:Conserved repeat domain protein n=1 Tax=Thiothrix nivea (strain ATCC 35100 / DSM 5205 / JP2) TaxID=870187 RepID=A0A656HL65_THINJ|nr:DUF11 domain-containing protein [Thiothrix nivea]EIJ36029.1 conserved repeat domain protein [Thiothrix nivea DSM 5205]